MFYFQARDISENIVNYCLVEFVLTMISLGQVKAHFLINNLSARGLVN